MGTLELSLDPPARELSLTPVEDGAPVPDLSGRDRHRLPAGSYRFAANHPPFAPIEEIIEISPGQTVRLERRFEISPADRDRHRELHSGAQDSLATGDVKAAISGLEAAARLDPRDHEAHRLLASCNLVLGRAQTAEKEARTAREIAPNNPEVLNTLAFVHYRAGRADLARPVIEELNASHPDHVEGWDTRGRIEKALEHPDEARKAWKRVLELAPNHRSARQGLESLDG